MLRRIGLIGCVLLLSIVAVCLSASAAEPPAGLLRKIAENEFGNLGDTSTLADPAVVDVALARGLADSVHSTLERMSRDQAVPWMGHIDSIPLILTLSPEERPDTVPAFRQLFKARVPRYDIPFSYAAMPVAGVDARYPLTARLVGLEDSVTLAFTVESDGTIAPESLDLVSASYRDFVTSVVEALGKTRYHPAHLGDCAVFRSQIRSQPTAELG